MNIILKENHTGNEIVKAFFSIPGYKTKIQTKKEVFDEKFGIIPGRVKIQMTSLSQDFYISPNAQCYIFITIDDIVLTCRYYVIDMQINQLRNSGTMFKTELINDNNGNKTKLSKKIEAVIRQFLKNLNINKA